MATNRLLRPVEAAALLRSARNQRRTLPLTDTWPDLDEAWGYAVQAVDREERTGSGDPLIAPSSV